MTTQKQFEKDAKVSATPEDAAGESLETTRELTDGEIASVSGGLITMGPYPPTNPPNGPGGHPTGNPPRIAR